MRDGSWRQLVDRRILWGRLYLGSTLWAVTHLIMGLVLWSLGAYAARPWPQPVWLLVPLVVVCAALLLRRTAPGVGLAVGTVVVLVDLVLLGPSVWVLITYGDLLYAIAAWGRRRLAYWSFAVFTVLGLLLFVTGVFSVAGGYYPGGPLGLLQTAGLYVVMFHVPMISGLTIREHRMRAELERQRAGQIARLAELDRANAVAEERGRMARELHDMVANHLSAIAVQSTAALSLREFDPERVRGVLEVVRDSSVRGLTEMRQMIGVLRADGRTGLERVTPRLREIGRLVAGARDAGMAVELVGPVPDGELSAKVDTTAYRIVQESLTNALRYARPQLARVEVHLVGGQRSPVLRIGVVNGYDPHAPSRWREGLGAGAGLAGMRERVALLDGVFTAGPNGAGEWAVRAELPLGPVDTSTGGERS
ncbi:sensor histidine kinase [Nocardiopsis ansamitocini]|uniref:histidine kinase n=1 Tax=Nocardiopsis ansamitocini TaxID=1670832 RepID=A0A9W6P2A4_9ACTN|nr:histidine kinase [Nocardiopsis ansamitocini]GLU45792.1 two-component sensor histidine kinase [Nocardiopsis ansamitocini]